MILKTLLSYEPTKWGFVGEIEEIQYSIIDKSNEDKEFINQDETQILKTELHPNFKKEVLIRLKTDKDKYFVVILDSIAYLMTNEGTTIEKFHANN